MKVSPMYCIPQNNVQLQKKEQENTTNVMQKAGGTKALGLSLAALATIGFAGVALGNPNSVNAPVSNKVSSSVSMNNYNKDLKMDDGNLSVNFVSPAGEQLDFNSMQEPFNKALNKLLESRKTDSNYSWVDLPAKLIKENYIENVYKTVNDFKKPFGNNAKLIFVALGNPSNADELVNAMGLGANLVYACDLTLAQSKDTIKKAGGDLGNIQVIISSKSGSTFESNQTYKMLTEEFKLYYLKKGVKPENIQKEVSKHFLLITDQNPEKSKLKKQAQLEGIATIDAVDALHSGFGDLAYSMPILAYSGLPEDSAKRMLKAADNMSKQLITKDLNSNMAGKIAAFDKIAMEKGATKEQFVFHDSHFTDFSMMMQQLYKESLRKLDFTTSVYPRAAHSGLEVDMSKGLKDQPTSIITNVSVRNQVKPKDAEEQQYIISARNLDKAHEMNLKKEGHFQKNIELNLGNEGLTPESAGEFVTLKSFVAFFKNEFENNGNTNLYEQSYVKGYKKIREDLETAH